MEFLGLSNIAIILGAILLAVSMHEAMHGYVAHWLGDTTAHEAGRLTLNPLKHIDLVTTILFPLLLISMGLPPFFVAKPVPFNPDRVKYDEYGAAMIGLAGPFTNLLMAGLTALLLHATGVAVGTGLYTILIVFIQVNIGFFVFNMIPFPPLDGSRLLYAFAPEPIQRFMLQIESMGFLAIFAFMFLLFPVLSPVVQSVSQAIFQFLLF